jgi:hypothetical protein
MALMVKTARMAENRCMARRFRGPIIYRLGWRGKLKIKVKCSGRGSTAIPLAVSQTDAQGTAKPPSDLREVPELQAQQIVVSKSSFST